MRLGSVPVEAEADVEAACAAALAGLDLTATPLPSFEAAHLAGLTLINAEIAAEFGALARSNATLGEDVRARILAALSVTPDDVAKAEMVRARFTAEVDAALTNVDALVLPTMPQVPPTLDEARDPRAVIPLTRLVRPFNLSGHPALTVPIRTGEGLPAGLQLVAPKGAEGRLCAMAQVFEERLSSSEPQEALT